MPDAKQPAYTLERLHGRTQSSSSSSIKTWGSCSRDLRKRMSFMTIRLSSDRSTGCRVGKPGEETGLHRMTAVGGHGGYLATA